MTAALGNPTVWHVDLAGCSVRVDGIAAAIRRLAASQERLGAGVRVWRAQGNAGGWSALSAMRTELKGGGGPDVVHFHSVFRPFHAAAAAAFTSAGIPYVVSPHAGLAAPALNRYRQRKRSYGALVERRFLRGAAAVFCLTEVERRDLHRFVPRCRADVHVIPNPLDESTLRPVGWRAPLGPPRVITLARYDVRQKGLDRLADLASRCDYVDFAVYGEQDKNERGRTDELRDSCPPNFRLEPPIFGEAKTETLANATMFAQPSRWEGLSMSLVEAMAGGVPTAVSSYVADTLPYREMELGLVLDDEPGEAAAALRLALGSPQQLEAWSGAAAEYARREFDPVSVGRRTLDAYAEVAP